MGLLLFWCSGPWLRWLPTICATIIVLMLRPLASAGRLASLNSGFLINCHCWGKMRPTSREQWDNEGGGEWMVWDGARARQEFASGPILPPPHLPASGNTATARGNCTPTLPWLGSFRIIQWCPKWLAKATFPVQSTIVNINLDALGN